MNLREIMTSPVVTLSPTAKVAEARCLMREHNVQHLPVLDSARLLRIITDRDIHGPRLLGQWNGGLRLTSASHQRGAPNP